MSAVSGAASPARLLNRTGALSVLPLEPKLGRSRSLLTRGIQNVPAKGPSLQRFGTVRVVGPVPEHCANSHQNGGSDFLIFVANPRTARLSTLPPRWPLSPTPRTPASKLWPRCGHVAVRPVRVRGPPNPTVPPQSRDAAPNSHSARSRPLMRNVRRTFGADLAQHKPVARQRNDP